MGRAVRRFAIRDEADALPPTHSVEHENAPARANTSTARSRGFRSLDGELVRRGQPVKIFSKVGRVTVETAGKALDEGALGATVRIELRDDKGRRKSLLQGVVIAPGTVRVGS